MKVKKSTKIKVPPALYAYTPIPFKDTPLSCDPDKQRILNEHFKVIEKKPVHKRPSRRYVMFVSWGSYVIILCALCMALYLQFHQTTIVETILKWIFVMLSASGVYLRRKADAIGYM